jgi:hypothetical protein
MNNAPRHTACPPAEYGFLFSVSVSGSPSVDPRDLDVCLFAKADGCLIQVAMVDRGPQVELIPFGATLETLPGVFAEIGGKGTAAGVGRTVDGTRPANVLAVVLHGKKSDQLQHALERNLAAYPRVINARHVA